MKSQTILLLTGLDILYMDALLCSDGTREWVEGDIGALRTAAGAHGLIGYINNACYSIQLAVAEQDTLRKFMWVFPTFDDADRFDEGEVRDATWLFAQQSIVAMSASDFLVCYLDSTFEGVLNDNISELDSPEDWLEFRKEVFDEVMGDFDDLQLVVVDGGRAYECRLADDSMIRFDNAAYYDVTDTCRLYNPDAVATGKPLFRQIPVRVPPPESLGRSN